MSAIVIILPTPANEYGDENQRGREAQELRMALRAIAGVTPPRARPVLAVNNEQRAGK